jgi:hypothetical protein
VRGCQCGNSGAHMHDSDNQTTQPLYQTSSSSLWVLSRDTRLKIRPLKRVSPIPRLSPFMEYSGRPNPDQARAQARLLKCVIKFDPMPSAEAKCQVATAQCHRQWSAKMPKCQDATAQCHRQWSAKMPKVGCYYLEGEEQDQAQGLRQQNAK